MGMGHRGAAAERPMRGPRSGRRAPRAAAPAAALCAAAAFACGDGARGGERRLAAITDIRVPASAPVYDTVRVAFRYVYLGCDTLEAVDTRQTRAGVTFAAWIRPTRGPCTTGPKGGRVVHLLLPPRPLSFSAVFRQPAGPDSVRTIRGLWPPAPAP